MNGGGGGGPDAILQDRPYEYSPPGPAIVTWDGRWRVKADNQKATSRPIRIAYILATQVRANDEFASVFVSPFVVHESMLSEHFWNIFLNIFLKSQLVTISMLARPPRMASQWPCGILVPHLECQYPCGMSAPTGKCLYPSM